MQMTHKVLVDDNFHYGDEDERYVAGEFATLEEAVAECRKIVKEQIEHLLKQGVAKEDLLETYKQFGEDPWTSGGKFSAWDYAKELCQQISSKGQSTVH